jgi:hypothetical protein
MAFENTEKQRKQIYDCVCQSAKNLKKLAADVKDYLDQTTNPAAAIPAVDLLERLCLENNAGPKPYYMRAHRGKMRGLYLYFVHEGLITDDKPDNVFGKNQDRIFLALRELWDVKDANIANCRELIDGTYQFYACSEDYWDHVVIGALRIEFDSGAARVTELQKNTPTSKTGEVWSGYGFMRRSRVVLTMSASLFKTPKFYLLNPYYTEPLEAPAQNLKTNNNDHPPVRASHLVGGMIKLGKDTGFFLSGIYMLPDQDAFDKVRVIPESSLPSDLPPDVRAHIHRWRRRPDEWEEH